jgi:hypothetical protein
MATLGGEAELMLGGRSSLKAALALDWGQPTAREHALRLVLEEGERWQRGLEPPPGLAGQEPRLQEVRDMVAQMVAQDTEPAPTGGPGGRRLQQHVAPDRRVSIEAQDRRPGRQSRAKTCNGFPAHFALALESKVTREVVVRPANEPEHETVELLAEE